MKLTTKALAPILGSFALFFAAMPTSQLFAHHPHPHVDHHHHPLIDIRKLVGAAEDFGTIVSALNTDYSYMGGIVDPDPTTNTALASLLATNLGVVNTEVAKFAERMSKFGVPAPIVATISTELLAFYNTGVAYGLAVNQANAGIAGADQYTAAAAFIEAGIALGTTLANISDNQDILTVISSIANLDTQQAQAWRLVLDTNNVFGAEPGDDASQTRAAIRIQVVIAELLGNLFRTYLPRG